MNKFKMDKREILQRISHGLQWENKPLKQKRPTAWDFLCKLSSDGFYGWSGKAIQRRHHALKDKTDTRYVQKCKLMR